jgi:hypothetical protein
MGVVDQEIAAGQPRVRIQFFRHVDAHFLTIMVSEVRNKVRKCAKEVRVFLLAQDDPVGFESHQRFAPRSEVKHEKRGFDFFAESNHLGRHQTGTIQDVGLAEEADVPDRFQENRLARANVVLEPEPNGYAHLVLDDALLNSRLPGDLAKHDRQCQAPASSRQHCQFPSDSDPSSGNFA